MKKEKYQINQSLFIPASLDEVWSLLLNGEKMEEVFQANIFDIDLEKGGEIQIPISFPEEDLIVIGEIGLVYPKSKFYFTWMETKGKDGDWFHNTQVKIVLEEKEIGTQVNFEHEGFERLPTEIREEVFQRYLNYWGNNGVLDRLSVLLSKIEKGKISE